MGPSSCFPKKKCICRSRDVAWLTWTRVTRFWGVDYMPIFECSRSSSTRRSSSTTTKTVPDYTDLLRSVAPTMLSAAHAVAQAGQHTARLRTRICIPHMPTSPMVGPNTVFGLNHSKVRAHHMLFSFLKYNIFVWLS